MAGAARDRTKLIVAGLGGILIGGAGVALAAGGGALSGDRAQVERIVREYVLANPEIIPEAMQLLQDRRMAEVVEQNRAAFETPFGSAWAGAEKGDVVLVEFFDYACGYCRKSNADIDRLLGEDKQLKVVWRELPVLGPRQPGRRGSQPRRRTAGPLQGILRSAFRQRPSGSGGGRSGGERSRRPSRARIARNPGRARQEFPARSRRQRHRHAHLRRRRQGSPGRGRLRCAEAGDRRGLVDRCCRGRSSRDAPSRYGIS